MAGFFAASVFFVAGFFAAVFLVGINEEDAAREQDLRRVIGPDVEPLQRAVLVFSREEDQPQ